MTYFINNAPKEVHLRIFLCVYMNCHCFYVTNTQLNLILLQILNINRNNEQDEVKYFPKCLYISLKNLLV